VPLTLVDYFRYQYWRSLLQVPGAYAGPVAQPAMMYPQPALIMNGNACAQEVNGGGAPLYNYIQQPPFNTVGLTGSDLLQQQMGMAQGPSMNRRVDMKPADDDPNLWYWVREQDGTWVQRNRRTIDSGDIGRCRWYIDNGNWYAVRLAD